MPNETLAERIGSAYDASKATQTDTSTPSTPVGEGGDAASSAGLIGIEDGSPAEGNGNDASAQQGAWSLAENVQPDFVVGMIDGKPVTAAEVKDGYMRTQDYTAKTTELANQRKEAEQYAAWYKQNETYIQGLNSENPEDKKATLLKLASDLEIDISPQRARDESGRFASHQQTQADTELYNLDEFNKGTEEYEAAARWNAQVQHSQALQERLDKLEGTFQQFTSNVTSQVEMQQRFAQAGEIASKWQQSGLEGVDVDGALKLVGQPMSIDEAMRLHHWDKVLRHNHNLAKGSVASPATPHEPAGAITTQGGSLRGTSLRSAIESR